jgi:hypothetical protein
MPVQLAHASRLDGHQCSGDVVRGREIAGIDDTNFPTGCFLGRSHRPHLEGVLDGRLHLLPASSCLVLRKRSRKACRKDIELVFRQLCDSVTIEIGILRQDLRRCVCDPRGDEEGVVFREPAFLKDKQELATIPWPETLNGMRIAGGEEREVALRIIHAPRRVPNETRESSM